MLLHPDWSAGQLSGQFSLNRFARGRSLRVDQLRHKRIGRLIGPRRFCDRLFTIDASTLREPMPTVRIDDAILGQMPEPQMERHRRVLEVIDESLISFDQDILDDVGSIDTAAQNGIHA
jgi:hypothetical protein